MNNRTRRETFEWKLCLRKVLVLARDELGNAISPKRQMKKALLAECGGSMRQLKRRLRRERREVAVG